MKNNKEMKSILCVSDGNFTSMTLDEQLSNFLNINQNSKKSDDNNILGGINTMLTESVIKSLNNYITNLWNKSATIDDIKLKKVFNKVIGGIKMKNKKKYKWFILIGILLIICLLLLIIYKFYNSNENKYKKYLDNYNIEELKKIYTSIDSYDERKKIQNVFANKLNDIVNSFALNTSNYEDTIKEVNKYSDLSDFSENIKKAKEDIEKIRVSKENFALAEQNAENNNIYEAIKYYSKIEMLDSNNYKLAINYINNHKQELRNTILAEIDEYISNDDYISAKEKLSLLEEIFNDDETINKKAQEINDKAKKQEIQKYKKEQEVSVISAKKYKEWYSDTTSGVQVIVKNNSKKVVKSYTVSVLAYDSSGFPLKIQYNNYETLVKLDGANIQPGKTHGKDNYCSIFYEQEKISSALACVTEVEYYDGTTWNNPYYEYWIEEYKEKPIN